MIKIENFEVICYDHRRERNGSSYILYKNGSG